MKPTAELWKVIGSALIIGAAACIMLPGLLGYFAGLWRLGVLVVVVIAIACLLGQIVGRAMILRQRKIAATKETGDEIS